MALATEELRALVDALVARADQATPESRSGAISLDEIADVIGTAAITPDQIGALLERIEATGRQVLLPPAVDLQGELRAVLLAARALSALAGRAPRVDAIAERTGLERRAVLRALLFARTLGAGP